MSRIPQKNISVHSDVHPVFRGVIGLMTVIIMGAIILSLGMTAAFLGQTQLITLGDIDRERTLQQVAETCVDEAIMRLKMNSGYAGGTVPVGSDSCTVVVSGSGATCNSSTRTVAVTATSGGYTKTLNITAGLFCNTAGNSRGWDIRVWRETAP
ncbi:MAG: hypothetical protein PHT12_05840 [Patescibacteria group bacterium]|nr:hypothetical protein [Patescibacteria group bacterium]